MHLYIVSKMLYVVTTYNIVKTPSDVSAMAAYLLWNN